MLSTEEYDRLKSIVRTRTLQAQVVTRARILLLKESCNSVDMIADKVDLNRNSVILCLKSNLEGTNPFSRASFRADVPASGIKQYWHITP